MLGKSLLVSCLVCACYDAWPCDKPAEAPQSIASVPDYTAGTDEIPDLQEAAARAAWRQYQDSVFDSLRNSSNPRDWAVAAVTASLNFDDVGGLAPSKHDDLIERAMRAAPDDALVQWIAMMRGPATHDAALRSLRALEPDNAAVWSEDLTAAMKRNDDAGVDAALARMSGSRRFDVHYVDLMKTATEAFLRHPVPDALRAIAAAAGSSFDQDELAYASAMTVTATTALPAFQHLVNACRIDPVTGKNSSREADCGAIGRLMAARGDTLIANRIGSAVLRVSRTYTDDDLLFARNLDWVYQQTTSALAHGTESEIAKDFVVRYRDWIETGSEVESMRRALVRRGTAPTPPEDWVDASSSFTAERLHSDAAWFEENRSK